MAATASGEDPKNHVRLYFPPRPRPRASSCKEMMMLGNKQPRITMHCTALRLFAR